MSERKLKALQAELDWAELGLAKDWAMDWDGRDWDELGLAGLGWTVMDWDELV